MSVKLSNGKEIPIEMHKIRIVQQTNLLPAADRLKAMDEAGYNTFLLRTKNIFLDMLTDSGVNAIDLPLDATPGAVSVPSVTSLSTSRRRRRSLLAAIVGVRLLRQPAEDRLAPERLLGVYFVAGVFAGGLAVTIRGGVKAFLPGSQVDLRPVRNLDRLLGQTFQFKVIKFNKKRGNIVLSRRVLLEKERDRLKEATLENLQEDQIVATDIGRVEVESLWL